MRQVVDPDRHSDGCEMYGKLEDISLNFTYVQDCKVKTNDKWQKLLTNN